MKINKEEYRTLVERSAFLDVILGVVRCSESAYEVVDAVKMVAGTLNHQSLEKNDEGAEN